MSYINDALRKAQKDKDNRYGKLDCVPPSSSGKRWRPQQQLLTAFVAIVVIVAVVALLFVKSPSAPAPAVPKLPEPSAVAGAVSPVLPEMREPAKTAKPAATPAANEKPRGQGVAGSSAAVSKKLRNGKKSAKQEPVNTEKPAASPGANENTRKQAVAEPSAAGSEKLQDGKKAEEIRRRYEEAALAQRNGNFNRAKILYKEILTLDAGNVKALNNLGVVCLAEKQVDKALALFRQAIVLKRDYADPYYNMACLYAQKNDIDQSLWYLKIAISIDKEVKKWVHKDADMKNVVTSSKFKEIDGGAKTDAAGENN